MSVNIHEIAELAGVSIATVSRALNNTGPIREKTKNKILAIAEAYQYKPNLIAKSLTTKQTNTIGLILPDLVDEFFMSIIHGIEKEAYNANRYVLVSSSHSQRNVVETLLEFMATGRVDGVILMAPEMDFDITQMVEKNKKPIVLLNRLKDHEKLVCFSINNYQGALSVTEHLAQHGYQKIAIIQGPSGNCDADDRFRGYLDALKKHHLPFYPQLAITGNFTMRSGYYAFNRLMSQSQKPDAIFASNDMMAIGAFQAAKSYKLSIPKDIALAGFDDIFASRLLIPRLTTVHVPINELGTKAIQYLLKMISGELDPKFPYFEELTTGLMIGGSCGCEPVSS